MKTLTHALLVSMASLGLVHGGAMDSAQAASLTWNIRDAKFDDGGILSGHFDYDADTGLYSNVRLAVSGGILDDFLYEGSPCGLTPTPGRTCLPDRAQNPDQFLVEVYSPGGYGASGGVKGWIFLSFLNGLTNGGGTIPLFNAGELWYVPEGNDTHRLGQRALIQGYVSANPTSGPTPVPEPMAFLGLALAGVGLTRVRRSTPTP